MPDAVSGFRAMNRETALTLNVITNYTYTVETIFQASKRNLSVGSIPIYTNPKTRDSRLVKSLWIYVKRMGGTIVRIYAMHEPLKTFFYFSLPFFLAGGVGLGRFILMSFLERNLGARFLQSVILSGVSLMLGVVLILIGLLADLISRNRRLIEDSLFRVKRMELDLISQKEREDTLLDEIRSLRHDLKENGSLIHPPAIGNELSNGLSNEFNRRKQPGTGSFRRFEQVEEVPVEDIEIFRP